MTRVLLASVSFAVLLAGNALAQEAELQLNEGDAALSEAPLPLSAESEVLNNTPFGDWLVNCEAISVSRVVCTLQQQLTITETGQLVVRMLAVPAADGGAILVAQVPIGVFLPGGAAFRLASEDGDDSEPQQAMVWQRCFGQVCEAAVQLTAEDVAAFEANDRMLFGYRMNAAGEPVIVSLDLAMFADGIAAIRQGG